APAMAGARPDAPAAAEAELLLLQSQALAEEEAAKARRELLTRFLQEKLSREQHTSAGALRRLRTLWRSALREAKDQELRADIETLSQTFSRVLDCKDGVIEALLRELEEAEEQHSRALRSHLSLIDQLLQLQRCRLGYLEQGFAAQVGSLKAEFEAERCGISGGRRGTWQQWCPGGVLG
ncbi:DRC2 protein, partial [Onychorhynchus coronatus]|nr:DRC2 protein [Onychorhynchus coronatus]